MSQTAAIVLVIGLAICVAIAAVWLVTRRTLRSSAHYAPAATLVPVNVDPALPAPALPQILSVSTDRPNEVYVFGPTELLSGYGTTLATTPRQLAKHMTRLQGGVDAARSYAEYSGRLVLVDAKTARALRSGKMMHDKYGEILGHVLRDDGKISSISRLRQIGGLGANVATLTNALSAMAMQAQLDRIERQLSTITQGVEEVHREQMREWHARTLGAQDALREVYGTATRTGELTQANWAQIAGLNADLRTQIHGDRDRLASAVAELEALAKSTDVSQRVKEVERKLATVTNAHAALRESSRAWAQFSTLRLWHLTVVEDPTLAAYRSDLEQLISSIHNELEPLRERTENALRQLPDATWKSRLLSPFDARKLPNASVGSQAVLGNVSWLPFEVEPQSVALDSTDGDTDELQSTEPSDVVADDASENEPT